MKKAACIGIFAMFLGAGCGNWSPEFRRERAKQYCLENGALHMSASPKVEGYLRPANLKSHLDFEEISDELLRKRFTYFEVPQKMVDVSKYGEWEGLTLSNYLAAGKGGRYFRFSLAEQGDPSCGPYESWMRFYPNQKLPRLRSLGLPDGMCISTVRADQPWSRYEIRVDKEYRDNVGEMSDLFEHYTLLDRTTGVVISEIKTNAFVLTGRRSSPGYRCKNQDQVEKFLEKSLIPIPDPKLAVSLVERKATSHPRFPVVQEIMANVVLESAEARPWAQSKREYPLPYSGAVSIEYDVLSVVDGASELKLPMRTLPTYVDFGRPIIVEVLAGFAVFGRERLSDPKLPNLAVLKYRRDGSPVAYYRVLFPSIELKGRRGTFVEDVSITDAGLRLTLLDMDGRPYDYKILQSFGVTAVFPALKGVAAEMVDDASR
jgi:hypothetical protein